jgi:hypothetical protein
MTGRIPELRDTEFATVKDWFVQVVPLVGGWHADDGVSDLDFTPEEAGEVSAAMARIFRGRGNWQDPDMLYDLAAHGSFEVEKAYPGFQLDVGLPSRRLGHAYIPGRELPNLLAEDCGQYVVVEFPDRVGPVSGHSVFVMKKASGPVGEDFDPSAFVVDEESAQEFDDVYKVEAMIRWFAGDVALDDDGDWVPEPGV